MISGWFEPKMLGIVGILHRVGGGQVFGIWRWIGTMWIPGGGWFYHTVVIGPEGT